MNALKKLTDIQQKNRSMICVGLDLDTKRVPSEFAGSIKGLFDFARRIIEATKDLVCAYKPNLAFYESLGHEGISLLRLITERIPQDVPIILDGKRGDISNTASHYAQSLFERLNADWVTLNPYMGYDSMRPFFEYKDKGVFVLCLTSNAGARDFQLLMIDGKPLYEVVAEKVAYWNKNRNCGLVVGATHPEQLLEIRKVAGDMPLLIPGVGAQGGALERAVSDGTDNFTKPAVINVSRSVLYASSERDFAEKARSELLRLNGIVESCKKAGEAKADDDGRENAQAQGQQGNNRENQQQQNQNQQNQQQQNQQHQQNQQPNQQGQQHTDRPPQGGTPH